MEFEARISEAAESFERANHVISGLKDLPSNDPVPDRKTVGAVTNEMSSASTNDMFGVPAVDALKGNMYQKVGVYYCCTSYG